MQELAVADVYLVCSAQDSVAGYPVIDSSCLYHYLQYYAWSTIILCEVFLVRNLKIVVLFAVAIS